MGSQASIPRVFTSTAWWKDDAKLICLFISCLSCFSFDEDHATYGAAPCRTVCQVHYMNPGAVGAADWWLSPNPIPWLQHLWGLVWVFSLQKTSVRVAPCIIQLSSGVKMPPAGAFGLGEERWEQNPEVQQPNPSLSKFIHCWGSVPPCSWYMRVFLCLANAHLVPSTALSLAFLVHLSKRHPFPQSPFKCYFFHVAFPSLMWFLLPLNPTVVYTFLWHHLPGCLSWNAHSEMMGPNFLWTFSPGPSAASLNPAGMFLQVTFQIEIDFLWFTFSNCRIFIS